jgi:hypothetical protein
MYTLRGRLLGGALSAMIASALLIVHQPAGWLVFAVPLLLAWGYVRYGPMVLAFRAYHTRDWPRLERLLADVRRPEWLRPQDRSYFEFLRGASALARGEAAVARTHLAAVDARHLRTDHIRCVLECQRAEAAWALGDPAAAAAHVTTARTMPHRSELDAELARLESLVAAG